MALQGKAALAMWWDIAPEMNAEFQHWHTHEHFPERLGTPGFRRSSRWTSADGGTGIFVLYELDDHAVLSSAAYLARLNAPTPWSTQLMPHHRNMVRAQAHVLESHGGVIARFVLTVRFSVPAGAESGIRRLLGPQLARWSGASGLVGAHLLRHETPPVGQTTEQRIRVAPDQPGDWVLIVSGYDLSALDAISQDTLSEAGAAVAFHHAYSLSYSAVRTDVAR